MRRLLVLLPLVGLLGCPGEVPDRDVDELDGGFDAPLGVPDARIVDAPLGAPDARIVDARVADAAISCSSGGRTGVCINTNVQTCNGMLQPGLCPGGVNIVCCLPTADASTFACNASDMPSPNAGVSEAAGEGGCPSGMLRIGGASGFCVDKYEAFLEVSDGQGGFSAWSPYFNPGGRTVVARSAADAVPQGYITGVQAGQACSRAGKRLCTNEEWLRACQGPDGLTYPYGNTRLPGVCNDARAVHPAVELFGSVTNLTSPCINQLPDSLDRAGQNPGCVTAEGAFDMMGNLHEWTSDAAGTFRGGFYVDTVVNGNGCLYRTTAHDTAYEDYSTGFRCCFS